MGGSIPQFALYVLAAGAFGVVTGLLVGAVISKRRIGQLTNECQIRLDDVTRQRDQFATESSNSRSTIESLQARVANGRTALEAASEKSKLLAKNVLTLRAERQNTKIKISTIQAALSSVKQQTVALQREFDKASEFYKGELVKSFEKRKLLEEEIEKVRSEQESFAKLVELSVLEHGSPNKMIAAAQLRLGQLDVLERNVTKLGVENAELRNDAKRMKQEYKALEKDLVELDELRINNKQLVRCVESLESSRKQHEYDAEQYRDQADQSEQLSDTLRVKLNDLEQSFADMDKQQRKAIKHARNTAVVPTSSTKMSSPKEIDGLQDVVDLAKYSNKR